MEDRPEFHRAETRGPEVGRSGLSAGPVPVYTAVGICVCLKCLDDIAFLPQPISPGLEQD